MNRRYLFAFGCVALGAATAQAHHSISANFDSSREVEIRGTVVDFNYVSPHSSLVIDGIGYENDAALSATAERWEIESSAVKGLAARGIKADTFKPGDRIIARGTPHRNPNLRRANSSAFIAADGTAFASTAPTSAAPAAPKVIGVRRVEGRWIPPFETPSARSALPLNAAGLAAWESYVQAASPANTCEPMSIPDVMNAPGYLFEVRIGDGVVVTRNEAYDVLRTVPLGERFAPADDKGRWGSVRGRIEGDTVIIESQDYPASKWGLGAATQVLGGGADVPSSPQKKVVETISASADGLQLYYDYIVSDPAYMTGEYRGRIVLRRAADDAPMVPYDCNTDSARQFSRAPGESLLTPN
jgi:hypothetical protein